MNDVRLTSVLTPTHRSLWQRASFAPPSPRTTRPARRINLHAQLQQEHHLGVHF